MKRDFLDRAGELDLRSWHFRLDDNHALDPAYVAALKREYTGLWYKRFVLGAWVMAEGAIFDMFDEDRHVVDELPLMEKWLAVGVDYGTANPLGDYRAELKRAQQAADEAAKAKGPKLGADSDALLDSRTFLPTPSRSISCPTGRRRSSGMRGRKRLDKFVDVSFAVAAQSHDRVSSFVRPAEHLRPEFDRCHPGVLLPPRLDSRPTTTRDE